MPPASGGRGGAGILCPGGITATPVIAPAGTPGKYTIYAASWDGMLHQLNVSDGEDVAPPSKLMPPNGKPYGSEPLEQRPLHPYRARLRRQSQCRLTHTISQPTRSAPGDRPGGGMWGRTGPAISADGTMYTGTGDGRWDPENGTYGNGIVGVKQNPDTKALELVDYYGPTNAEWLVKRDLDMQVTPAIFNYKGHELMVDAGKECRLYLMDTKSIGGDDHRTPLYRSPLLCNEDVNFASAGIWGSLASWEDSKGMRWVLTPILGAETLGIQGAHRKRHSEIRRRRGIQGGREERQMAACAGLDSRDMNRAEPPVIANGVIFAYGNGEDTDQAYPDVGLADSAERRIPGSTHAVLYALDAQTGKELWSSGDQITSWNHWSGLSVANGRVYIGTYDSNAVLFRNQEVTCGSLFCSL